MPFRMYPASVSPIFIKLRSVPFSTTSSTLYQLPSTRQSPAALVSPNDVHVNPFSPNCCAPPLSALVHLRLHPARPPATPLTPSHPPVLASAFLHYYCFLIPSTFVLFCPPRLRFLLRPAAAVNPPHLSHLYCRDHRRPPLQLQLLLTVVAEGVLVQTSVAHILAAEI